MNVSPTLFLAKKTWHIKMSLKHDIAQTKTFKVMVFTGELDYGSPDKMILAS